MLTQEDRQLVAALQRGLALQPQPYAQLAREAGMTEAAVVQRLQAWIDGGVVRRLGLILRHRELGFRANAMVVWDVPDDLVGGIGRALAEQPGVTLCYRRCRAPACWPFNLYCMIHGRERQEVLERLESITHACGLEHYPSRVLFSRTRFKQRGAYYMRGDPA
jgi:DNA-binding Lrp family transcriptional regulator